MAPSIFTASSIVNGRARRTRTFPNTFVSSRKADSATPIFSIANRTFFPEFSAASATGRASRLAGAARVEEKPVAICRLKRVAADHRGDIESRLPPPAQHKNGRRVALIGAGCASLTVANDLAPLGYDCVIFEALARPGGLMRTNIPAFRLPAEVLDEEIGYVTRLGVEIKLVVAGREPARVARRGLRRRVRRQRRA